MKKLSKRYKIAGTMEMSSFGIGISVAVRKYWRKFFASTGAATMRNAGLNDTIASDFKGAEALHRFILRTGEVGEIRKSGNFYYIGVIRHNSYDVIFIQPSMKAIDPARSKEKLKNLDWVEQAKKMKAKRP